MLLGLAAVACGGGAWDVAPLEMRYPALRQRDPARLAEAQPYLLPADGVLTAFLCRWPAPGEIPVSLPPDATDEERRTLEAALAAWEGAGLGLRFAPAAPAEVADAGIAMRFVETSGDDDPGPAAAPPTATTTADCLVGAAAFASPPPEVLPARLVRASIHLRRSNPDPLGRAVALTPDQLAGSALHELGHALGYQGHARRGRSVMVRAVSEVRLAGRRVLAGRAFADAALASLYAVPAGVVVRRVPVGPAHTRPLDRILAIARARGFAGPLARVGERVARIAWSDAAGASYALLVPRPADVLRGRAPLRVLAYGRSADLLEGVN